MFVDKLRSLEQLWVELYESSERLFRQILLSAAERMFCSCYKHPDECIDIDFICISFYLPQQTFSVV